VVPFRIHRKLDDPVNWTLDVGIDAALRPQLGARTGVRKLGRKAYSQVADDTW